MTAGFRINSFIGIATSIFYIAA